MFRVEFARNAELRCYLIKALSNCHMFVGFSKLLFHLPSAVTLGHS